MVNVNYTYTKRAGTDICEIKIQNYENGKLIPDDNYQMLLFENYGIAAQMLVVQRMEMIQNF